MLQVKEEDLPSFTAIVTADSEVPLPPKNMFLDDNYNIKWCNNVENVYP